MLMSGMQAAECMPLFETTRKTWEFPELTVTKLEDVYDEIELLGFPVSMEMFKVIKQPDLNGITASQLGKYTGRQVEIAGIYVTYKPVHTVKKSLMAFGTFLDREGNFFDTIHFPPCLQKYTFKGNGVYSIKGKVVEEFGFPSLEVEQMQKLPVKPDPRS